MRAARYFAAVDSHTEGMPTRVITGGVGTIPGATALERKLHFEEHMDELRLLLMREPRGHGAMSGAILQPPTRPDADWGVIFIEVSGCLPMCGHGTIGVATVLVETGMVEVTEPETVVRLDVPAGLVEARVRVENGRARSVTIRNVPSFLLARDRSVEVPGLGKITYDMAFGGNFYALTPAAAAGLSVDPAQSAELVEAGLAVMAAINAAERPEHPADPRIAGCRHVVFHEPGPRRRRRGRGHVDPPGLARPLAVRHRHERPHGPVARPRRAGARRGLRQRVRDRDPLHRPAGRHGRCRRNARGRPGDHGPGLDHRHGSIPTRRGRSVPSGFLLVTSRGGQRAVGAHGAIGARDAR